jgi:hypothetical protein
VPGRLSSHRFRRRLLWTTIPAAVIGGLVVAAILIGNTGHNYATPIDHSKPASVYKMPPHLHLTRGDRGELFVIAMKFVRTAVVRKHLDSAWDMLGPEMKAGQTRKSWDTGFNNVVPFPADGVSSWSVAYSFKNDVALDLALVHRGHSSEDWSAKTFTLELKRDVTKPGRPWLVAAWVPKGVGGGGTLDISRRVGPPPPAPKSRISPKWLLVPAAFLGVLVLTLVAWALTNAVRGRRAARRYAEALGYSSSAKPS